MMSEYYIVETKPTLKDKWYPNTHAHHDVPFRYKTSDEAMKVPEQRFKAAYLVFKGA